MPRNLIHWGNAEHDSEDPNAGPEAILEAIRRGNLSVTSGPVIDFAIFGKARRVRWLPVKRTTDVVRLDTSLELILPEKTFVVVVARGERALPNVFQAKVRPYAFTNPVWIEP